MKSSSDSVQANKLQARITDALRHVERTDKPDVVRFLNDVAFNVCAGLVHEVVSLSSDLVPRERERIVMRTLLYMCRNKQAKSADFNARAKVMQSDILKARSRTYHILAYVPAKQPLVRAQNILLDTKVGGVQVRLIRKYPAQAATDLWVLGGGYGSVELRPVKTAYVPVWVTLKARSEQHAAHVGVSRIQAVLGCLNFCLNYQSSWIHSGPATPYNRLRLAGEQVVYAADWTRYTGEISYEENFYRDHWPVDLEEGLEKRAAIIPRALRRLNDPVFGPLLVEAMQDYQEALSHTDSALVLARLWSLLERLTNTRPGEPVTVRRAAFLSASNAYRRRSLQLSADARHAFVHRRERVPFVRELSEDLRMYADHMLSFICFTRRKFPDLQSFFRLLDVPTSRSAIGQQIRIYQIARSILRS